MNFNGFLMGSDNILARIEQNQVIPLDPKRMPLYFTFGGNLEEWLAGRAIDRYRPNSHLLKRIFYLEDASDAAVALHVHAATITDHFWVKSDNESDLKYKQVRFLKDNFAEIALAGRLPSNSREFSSEEIAAGSPELTSIGSFEKCWRLKDDGWWLHKCGTPLERFSEIFISNLGKELGFSMAEYFPSGSQVKTRDFTEGKYNFEPAESLVGDDEDYSFNYDRLTSLDSTLGPQYLDILYLDALCFNMDRHTRNYGILRDQTTGNVLCMAPNFDNNIALISRGYSPDPTQTNCLLGQLFVELLEEKGLYYKPPVLTKSQLSALAENTLPGEDIDRKYVVAMILERWQRINQML